MATTITIVEQKYHVVACPECEQTGFKLVGTGEYSTTRLSRASERKLLCGGEGTDGCGVMMGELKGLVYYGPEELVTTSQVSNPNSNGDFTTDIRGIANPQRYTINSKGRVYLPLPIIVTPELAEVAVCRVDGQVCGAALKWDWYPPLDKDPAPGPQYTIWGIRTRVIEPVPRLILDSNSRTRGERKIRFEVLPTTYPAYSVVSEFYEDGHLMVKASHSGMPLEAHQYTLITGGLSFLNPGGLHNTRVIVNDGWHWPFQGKDIPLSIYSRPVNVPVTRVDITYEREEMPYLETYWRYHPNPDQAKSDILITTIPATPNLPIIICSTRVGQDGALPDVAGHDHGPAPPELPIPPALLDPADVQRPDRWPDIYNATDTNPNILVYYAWGGFSYPRAVSEQVKELHAVTNTAGRLEARYHAPNFSGKQTIVIDVDGDAQSSGAQFVKNVDVKWPGLVEFEPGAQFLLIGSILNNGTRPHFRNHFGTHSTILRLLCIALEYHRRYLNDPPLQYNDMSLEWGGFFDIGPTQGAFWRGPHTWEHRDGVSCDIRIVNNAVPHLDKLRGIITQMFQGDVRPEGNPIHWHTRFPD